MSELPSLSFLKAIERNISEGFSPEEQLAEARRIASNPRAVDRTARELDDLYKTLLSGDYLEDLISAAELGLAEANAITINPRIVPKKGGARNVALAKNRGQIDRKQKEVDRMQNLFDVLSKIKSGSQEKAPPSQEVVEKPKKVADESAVPVEEVEEEMGEPAIRKRDARFLDRLDERVLEDLLTEPVEDSDYDPTKNEMYGSGLNDDYDPTKNEMYGSGPEVEEPAPPKAVRVSPEELAENEKSLEQDAISMFKNTHGTEFDPKSKEDRKKLNLMTNLLTEQGGLGKMTPNQFALKVYRNS